MFDSDSVEQWVDYIQTLHAREIELSLERVREVYHRLFPRGITFKVVSVAGTNGKGSTTELLASSLKALGFVSGKFTSPHISIFNERFNVNGVDVSNRDLLTAFRRVELARGAIPVTYFEYGVLLALLIFDEADVEVAVLEVGLGGRLDAVNIVDSDVSVITSISLDHTDWLGDNLEKIAYEKAGIARAGKPCVIGVREPQASILEHLKSIGSIAHVLGDEFDWKLGKDRQWSYESVKTDRDSLALDNLPLPFGQTGVQLDNASLAIKVLSLLSISLVSRVAQLQQGIRAASLLGRCQILNKTPLVILDVAHNEASVKRLSEFVCSAGVKGRVIAVCGMLKDKEILTSFAQIADQVDSWYFASIDAPRGATAKYLQNCLSGVNGAFSVGSARLFNNVSEAFVSARSVMQKNDCLVVFGSFYIASDIIKFSAAEIAVDDVENTK